MLSARKKPFKIRAISGESLSIWMLPNEGLKLVQKPSQSVRSQKFWLSFSQNFQNCLNATNSGRWKRVSVCFELDTQKRVIHCSCLKHCHRYVISGNVADLTALKVHLPYVVENTSKRKIPDNVSTSPFLLYNTALFLLSQLMSTLLNKFFG